MKKSIRVLSSVATASIILLISVGSVFADREMIISDLPKQGYRYGVGAYEGVVAHSTATPEAPAINIQKYESRTWRNAFVHYAVDWDETIQIADTKYIAYGGGPAANKRFVHVELCETADYTKFKRSYEKYVKLLAEILKDNKIAVEKGLWTHSDVTHHLGGTDHEDPLGYLKSHGVSESKFRADVLKAYNGDSISVEAKPQQPNEVPGVINEVGVAYIDGYNVNLRSGPSTSNSVIRKLQNGESYKVWGKLGNWLNLGGNQWIYYDSSYIRYKEDSSSIVGKRVVSKVDNLRFYNKPSWKDGDVAGIVNVGEGFTIDEKIMVDGSRQYKVHNSKDKTYCVTANAAFIYVQ
ncbi:N-acetylmuramoyl-L-alanine amidase [Bacillus thuringiensis LM1212]|uniref:N-acetylmuramoyl-L-alanine amidase n=1 Tax=Bacillus cereus group TaxID=86661 RepID=UPI0004177E9E|nr:MULTISPECIES: N-acetylmuramoyl-L-alanine amidase [Bacillus cereus group]AXY08563.1 N-acetylmuramoyl-L-alanine amidase [Bacillus thuringiensis LM1212]QDF26852.1 N-acetylmuramoyl-L-alanine amidase [Bacillus tropicus]QUG94801.1 N-acetylmuramoyl-L-alanine amidase [Bacillus tropicus]